MSEPRQTCALCGRYVIVRDVAGGRFPPDVAKKQLTVACHANNCPCKPVYRAGVRA